MKHAYTIRYFLDGKAKKLPCTSAWVAYEQHSRLVRQGRNVRILDKAGKPVTIGRLEAAAQVETVGAVTRTEPPGGVPVSARSLLMGS